MKPAVQLFVPCYVDQLHPQAGIAAVELLESLGYVVHVEPSVACCGQPFANSGSAREGMETTALWFARTPHQRPVVVLSSSCAVHLDHNRATGASHRVFEICEFLQQHHGASLGGSLSARVCLHSSCHGLRDSGSDRAARELLSAVRLLEVRRPARAEECCGFGGTFSDAFPRMSVAMGADRLESILETEPEELVATDLSCLVHLQGIARARGLKLPIRHVVEVLREATA